MIQHVLNIRVLLTVFLVAAILVVCRDNRLGPRSVNGQGESGPISPVISLPRTETGDRIDPSSKGARVKVEAYLDMLCPDSADAWVVLQEVQSYYGSRDVSVIIHQFPLPYHRWSYVVTMGYFLIRDRLPGQHLAYLSYMMSHQYKYSNTEATDFMTYDQIVSWLSADAHQVTEISESEFKHHLHSYRGPAVNNWKYACRKGVAGTPWYAINGVDITLSPSVHLTFKKWRNIIDPLLNEVLIG